MRFSIITPSFNQLDHLKLCTASIFDQARDGIEIEHFIQDGGSEDGTVEWLNQYTENVVQGLQGHNYFFGSESTPDNGMYDALNKGIDHALRGGQEQTSGVRADQDLEIDRHELAADPSRENVIAWLNCDEQYLPGTLEKVARYFRENSDVDFVYGNALLLNEKGELLTYRKSPPLRKCYVQSDHLYVQSCTMFFRERIFRSGFRFDTQWKSVSDSDFVIRLLNSGFQAGRISEYLAIFFVTGTNLSGSEKGMAELNTWRQTMPVSLRRLALFLRGCRYFEKLLAGAYHEKFPMEYFIYLGEYPEARTRIKCLSGSSRFISWER